MDDLLDELDANVIKPMTISPLFAKFTGMFEIEVNISKCSTPRIQLSLNYKSLKEISDKIDLSLMKGNSEGLVESIVSSLLK